MSQQDHKVVLTNTIFKEEATATLSRVMHITAITINT